MEYIIVGLLCLSLLLSLIIIVCLSSLRKRRETRLDEENLSHIRDTIRNDNEASFSRFQDSLDRDMDKLSREIREREEKIDSKLFLNNQSLNRFMTDVTEKLSLEGKREGERTVANQRILNENFDRIRCDNREAFKEFSEKSEKLTLAVKEGMDGIRRGNEERLRAIQDVVDQKLQETLDKKISLSFKAVTENLEKLYESMGALNTLSTDVKRMNSLFSNVKSRGVWGEIQAENILSDILSSSEWVKNYSPRGNREMVEFAIRMPGKEGEVFLPIDSKFPVSDLERYKAAYDEGNKEAMEKERKNLRERILSEARDINRKYIVPPYTTDFAILFVPSETIYLETIKMDGLLERLQNEYRVVITGPNNFAALLNSLRLGFRTMQIEEYTSAIWHLFEDMKKLFSDLSSSIEDSRKHVEKAQESLSGAQRKKEKLSSVLSKIESCAEKANIDEIDVFYEEAPALEGEKE